ncbi:MAG: lysylphosphatidylglycerol synthase transmembrane domain-containing protein [Mycobacteriaceae bacterium]
MSGSDGVSRADARRRRMQLIRWTLAATLVAVLAVEVALLAPSVRDAVRRLGDVSWWWVGAAIMSQAVSMSAFGHLQRRLLTAAGVPVRQIDSTLVVYAASAMSLSLPGGPLFSTTFTFRQTRRWGASRVVASWQLAMSGVLATAGLALMGVVGAVLVGGSINFVGLSVAIAAAIALIYGLRFVATHPSVLLTGAQYVLRWVNAVRGHPAEAGMDRVHEILEQLETVQLSQRDLGAAAWWATFNWIADVGCLAFACIAAGAHPSIGGLLIAYSAGKVVAAVPLLPGGLGVVDGTLTAALVATGLAASVVLPAVIVFRLISFPLIAIAGWVVFVTRFRSTNFDPEEPDPSLGE